MPTPGPPEAAAGTPGTGARNMTARPPPSWQRLEPAWGTLNALALARVVVTAFVLVSAMTSQNSRRIMPARARG